MAAWHHQLDGRELSKLSEMVKDRETGHAAVHGVTTEQHEQLNNNKKGFPPRNVFACYTAQLPVLRQF